ncbi:MAG: hypothetical protein WBK94_00040, partial [Tenuifilaceae bacterium]
MIKRVIYIFFSLLILAGCNLTDPFSKKEGDCQSVTLNFGFEKPSYPEVTVRAPEPLPLLEEAISDLYLFVFDEEGNKRESLSRYYSREDLGLVYPFNQGGLSGITLPKGANMIYLIANVEASHNMDVSKVALDTIATEAQLKALEVKFK